MMVGPDTPIVHPALFPISPNDSIIKEEHTGADSGLDGMATIREWMQFDWKAGWGDDDFEDDDDDFDVSIGNTTGGSFFNRSTNQSNNTSLKKNDGASGSAAGSSSNPDGEDAKSKNVSDVVEVEEYDSFDDDF